MQGSKITPEEIAANPGAFRKATKTRGPRRKTNLPKTEGVQLTAAHQRRREMLFGTPTDDSDPGEVLLQEIRRTAGHIEWLRLQLMHSDPEQFVRSLWLRGRISGYVGSHEIDTSDWSAAGALWVELYQSERKHLASICRTALAAGIEERRIRLAERLAERVGEAIRGMLYDLGLDPEDDNVRSVVYKWLSQAQGVDTKPATALPIDP